MYNEEFKRENIYNNIVYIKKLKTRYLSSIYYLIFQKINVKNKNI